MSCQSSELRARISVICRRTIIGAEPLDVQQLIDLGRVISDIRKRPPFNRTQRTAAARILATLPPDVMELLEPDASLPPLQAMCRRLVLAIVEFSKLGPDQNADQLKIFRRIRALHISMDDPRIRKGNAEEPHHRLTNITPARPCCRATSATEQIYQLDAHVKDPCNSASGY